MASVTYEFEKIITQLSKKGRKSLSAQQMAMMTRQYGNSALENDDFDDGRETKMTVKDDTTDSKRASWFGFSSWVGGLFSENIIFSFNGTQIKGKADHQVRGGVVPLFNGVVLDLTPASMTGRSEGGKQSVYPSKETDAEKTKGGVTPAKLVVSPRKYSFMTEHPIADFMMEAPKEGEVDVFSATIRETIKYAMRYSGVLEADGAEVGKDSMKLENPRIVQGEDKINYETAEVNGQGIFLGAEKEEVRDEENNGEGNSESNGESNGDNEEGGGRSFVDLKKGAAGLNSEENGANVDLQTGDVGFNNEDLEITGNIFKGTFKLGFGKEWSSDEEEGDKEEKETEQTETEKAVKEAIQEYFNSLQEKSKDALGKLGFAGEALIHFFTTGRLPENPYENEEENKNKEVELTASVPILAPFLNFKASLIPIWKFGFHVGFEITEGEKPKLKVNENNGRIIVSSSNIKRRIILTGDLRGKIGAKLKLALAAGLGYLFDVSAGLFAEGDARGILDGGGDDIFGKARLEIPVTVGDEGMKIDGRDPELLTINAGIGLEGKVGAGASVESTLFGWEKDLWSYTFGTWKPAELQGMFKLRKVKGPYGNKTSWKREESKFEFRLFKKRIEGSERYGIKLAREPERMDLLTREGKLTRDKIEELHKTLLGIEETIQASKGGQYGSENSEAYKGLKNQLKGIYDHFNFLAAMGGSCFDQMAQELRQYKESSGKSLQVAEAKIQTHEKRKAGMMTWGGQFGEGEKKGAYEYYKGTFGGKQAEKLKDQARTETAKHSVATKEALIAYETKRILELGKKSNERIEKLEARINKIKTMPEEKREVMNRELVNEYKEKNDKELLRYARQFAGRELIIKHEKESEAEYGGKHLTRVRLLEAWLQDNSVSDKSKPNRAFAEYYHNKADAEFKEGLGAKRFFRPEVLLEYHQNGEKILEYEKERLKSKAGAYIERIEALESAKKNNTEIEYKGDLGKRFQLRLDTAKAASKVEILAYEREKAENKDQRLKKDKDYKAVDKVLTKMKKGEKILCGKEHGLGFWDIWNADSVFRDYKEKLTEKPKDMSSEDISIFQEAVTLDVLQKQNIYRMREIGEKKYGDLPRKSEELEQIWKEKEAEFMKSSYKDQIVDLPGERLKDKAYYYTVVTDHEFVSRYLWGKRAENMKEGSADMTDSEQKSAQQMLKGEFFSYFLLDKDGKLNKNGQAMMGSLHRGSSLDTDELKMALFERYLEEYEDIHVKRYGNLREFMGLKKLENGEMAEKAEEEEQARRSTKTDTQVWDYYRSLGAGRGFAEEYVNKKNRNFSIDDMLRYEQYEARAHSGRNAFKALIQRGVLKVEGEFLSQEGADEQLKEFDRQREEGNHYDRYCKLKEAVESKKSNKEIMEIYRGLGGGNGYAEYLTDKDMRILDEVTPQEILNYENTWKGEAGEVHKARLARIQELKKSLSPEEFYKEYRKMVLEESVYRRAWDKLTNGRSGIDFDESKNAEAALTPEIILQYEKKCRDDITRKHQDRLDHLQQADVTDEDALQVYTEEGGGKAFFREKSTELSLAKAMLGESADYDNILKYEDTRIKYYEKAKKEIEDAVKKIEEEQKAMSAKIEMAKTDMERVKRILDSFESKPIYSNPDAFTEFRKEALGPDIQEGVEQVADIDKVSEREEEELDRLKEAQMKLLLDEELFLIDNM